MQSEALLLFTCLSMHYKLIEFNCFDSQVYYYYLLFFVVSNKRKCINGQQQEQESFHSTGKEFKSTAMPIRMIPSIRLLYDTC